ncbi:hypothetical protein PUS82_14925 [Cytobacillus firmus]|uniref:hypothetical protein n=1 Tax=Cytobacillus firmus TaxID=1399 RepID=UPI00237C1E39|nr:hypothetical protein [Cytobacillus firmus]MDD9312567.1 hypothetical protein [Cytobacillus firmus]
MKRYTFELDEKTISLLQEINNHYNKEDGYNSSIEETLTQIINSYYIVEIESKKGVK